MTRTENSHYLNQAALAIAFVILASLAYFFFGDSDGGLGLLVAVHTVIGVITLRLHMLIWDTNLTTVCSGDSPVASILLPVFLWPLTMMAGILWRVMRFLLGLAG